jgi:hypothetical protein
MKLLNIETVGDRIYATFDTDQRFEVLFVTKKEDSFFMKVLEHTHIRFYKIAEKDYNMLQRKFIILGINKNPQTE